MPDVWDSNKLALFLAFVMPGFIAIKFYQLMFPSTSPDSRDLIVDAISYSSINYALLFIPIISIENSDLKNANFWIYISFYFFSIFFSPVLLVILWKMIRTSNFFQQHAPHPTKNRGTTFLDREKLIGLRLP